MNVAKILVDLGMYLGLLHDIYKESMIGTLPCRLRVFLTCNFRRNPIQSLQKRRTPIISVICSEVMTRLIHSEDTSSIVTLWSAIVAITITFSKWRLSGWVSDW